MCAEAAVAPLLVITSRDCNQNRSAAGTGVRQIREQVRCVPLARVSWHIIFQLQILIATR
jgi:hypothetical protein